MVVVADVRGDGGAEIGGEAAVSFVHGTGPAITNIVVEWDFDGDGNFDQPEEDITGFLSSGETLLGRDWPSQVNGKAGPGAFRFQLINQDDRFSSFNAGSPLNQPPYSLATGRTIRVRTAESTPVDPSLLAMDHFNGAGALGNDETGNPWTAQTTDLWTRTGEGHAVTTGTDDTTATVDVGVDDYYIQLTTLSFDGAAIVYRFDDNDNYGFLSFDGGFIDHYTVVGGVETLQDFYQLFPWRWRPATIGILVTGTDITGYAEGIPLFTGTAQVSSSTLVGIIGSSAGVKVSDFRVWDVLPSAAEGVLWTGDVSSVMPTAPVDGRKTVEVTGEGRMAVAAANDVAVGAHIFGTPTGLQVGALLAAAELLHPPGSIALGDVTTGAVAFGRGKALDLARRLEDTELGFLHEAPDGTIGYEARSARAGRTPTALFSDQPGAQFSYRDVTPADWRREITNRVLAGLAPRCPSWPIDVTGDSASTAAGVQNDVNVTMPTVAEGALILVVIASTVNTPTRQWLVPDGWKQLANEGDSYRLRAYAKVAIGTEGGTNVKFYDDISTFSGGLWKAEIFTIPPGEWFGSLDGVVQAAVVAADVSVVDSTAIASNPPALVVPWGLDPSFFVTARAGLVSVGGGNGGVASGPPGYMSVTNADQDGASAAFDISFHLATKVDAVETEDPGPFGSVEFGGFVFVCSVTIAVRGWNGDPPLGNGRQLVQVDNIASQRRHRVRTLPTTPDLFGSDDDAEAYAARITAIHGDDRPIVTIEFVANTNEAYRAQAVRRRVGDMIHLTADHSTGLGIDGNFFIEHISNRFDDAAVVWRVQWMLSPA